MAKFCSAALRHHFTASPTILSHAFARGVAQAQIAFSLPVILLGGSAIPLCCVHIILRHALAILVADPQIALSQGVILLGGLAIPLHRFHIILRHALAIVVAVAK